MVVAFILATGGHSSWDLENKTLEWCKAVFNNACSTELKNDGENSKYVNAVYSTSRFFILLRNWSSVHAHAGLITVMQEVAMTLSVRCKVHRNEI